MGKTLKKSTIIYHDALAVVDEMPDDMAGKFVKELLRLMQNPSYQVEDFSLKIALHPFVSQFKRDSDAYEKQCEKNKLNGSLGGRPKKTEANPNNPSGLSKTEANPNNPDKDKDKDNGTDNGKDSETDILKNKKTKKQKFCPVKFKPEWITQDLWDSLLENRKFKKLQNTKLALQTFINAIGDGVKHGFTAEECIGEFCSSGWKRFNWDWMPTKNQSGPGGNRKTFAQIRSENNAQACIDFVNED